MAEPAPRAPSDQSKGYMWYRGGGWWEARRGFPWLGAFLVALGAALAVDQAGVGVSTGHALALFAGLVFGAAFVSGWGGGAGLVGAVLTGWGLARVLEDLGYIGGSGWTWLLLGAAFLVVYLVGQARHAGRHGWALWVGLILAVVGAGQIGLREVPGIPPLDAYVVPVLFIVVGGWLVLRALQPRPG